MDFKKIFAKLFKPKQSALDRYIEDASQFGTGIIKYTGPETGDAEWKHVPLSEVFKDGNEKIRIGDSLNIRLPKKLIFNPALEGGLILGGYMKEEAMKVHAEAVVAADEALYGAGYADGVIDGKKEVGTFTQADIDAAKEEGKKLGAEEYKANDPTPIAKDEFDKLKALYDADELTIGKMKEILGIAVVAPTPAPEKPVEQAPVDGTKGTDAQP